MRTSRTRYAWILTATALLSTAVAGQLPSRPYGGLWAPIALATADGTGWGSTPLAPDFDPVMLGLEPEPLEAQSLGVSFHVPADATVVTERLGGQVILSIQDGAADRPRWSMRVERVLPAEAAIPSPASHVATHVKRLRDSGVPFRIVENTSVECRGVRGQRLYIEQSAADGNRYLAGLMVMPAGPDPVPAVLTFAVLARYENEKEVRAALDASWSTIGVRSVQDVFQGQMDRLNAGHELLESMTPERLRSAIGWEQWYRIHRPAVAAGERPREIGYTVIETREAPKGALNPDRQARTYDTAEREEGLLVTVQGRVVIDPATETYLDSIGQYWLAWDRSSEAWSFLTTHRVGKRASSDAETGIRSASTLGDPVARLTVIRSSSLTYERDPFEWVVPGVYMSSAMSWIVGPIMSMNRTEPLEFGYYAYQGAGQNPSITLHVDSWTRTADGGAWTLRSRTGSDRAAVATTYDDQGRLLERRYPDGARSVPIEVDDLRRIWQGQGLQVGRNRP